MARADEAVAGMSEPRPSAVGTPTGRRSCTARTAREETLFPHGGTAAGNAAAASGVPVKFLGLLARGHGEPEQP